MSPPGVSRGAWPGLKPPQPGVSQQLFESAGLAGGFRQAQDRVGLPASQQRVLPVPPGAGPAAKSSTTTSTARPALGQELDPLDKPKSGQVRPPTDAIVLQFVYKKTADTAVLSVLLVLHSMGCMHNCTRHRSDQNTDHPDE